MAKLPAFLPDGQYKITLSEPATFKSVRLLPRDEHTVNGVVAEAIKDKIITAEKVELPQ